jgi:hypothetical protein
MHGFVPISMQDSAIYGTFNSTVANDPVNPYAWRYQLPSAAVLLDPRHPISDVKWRSTAYHLATTYIKKHPGSVAEAFFWNGLSRFWDIRHRSRSLDEVRFEGRSRFLTNVGLDLYLVLLPLSLVGLWRVRRRREVLFGVLAVALGASIVFTAAAGTRYRAPLEPLIAVLACAGALGAGSASRDAAERARTAAV